MKVKSVLASTFKFWNLPHKVFLNILDSDYRVDRGKTAVFLCFNKEVLKVGRWFNSVAFHFLSMNNISAVEVCLNFRVLRVLIYCHIKFEVSTFTTKYTNDNSH